MIKKFNDFLAVLLIVVIIGIWTANNWINIPAEVNGALIAAFMLVVQFYFRRAPKDNEVK